MFKIFAKVFVIFCGAAILSIIVNYFYLRANHLTYQWPRNIFPKPPISRKYQIVKVGNSHADDGVTFDHFKMRSLSLSGAGQTWQYDLVKLKMYANQIDDNAIILIDISQLSFSQGKPRPTDSLTFKYYDGAISPFLIPNLQVGNYLESTVFPFVRATYLWRQDYAKQVEQQALNSFATTNWAPIKKPIPEPLIPTPVTQNPTNLTKNLSAQQEIAASPYQSDAKLQDSVIFIINKWHTPGDFGPEFFAANRTDLENLIEYCQAHHWRPVLMTIPISQRLTDGLGQDYLTTYVTTQIKKTNLHGSVYLDFSDQTALRSNGYFWSDSDHLSDPGRHVFSHLLMEQLLAKGFLTPAQNGFAH